MHTLSLLDELEAVLSCGQGRRIRILTGITDLFVASAPRYSQDQIGVFDEVMTRLVGAIEAKARARLAHRLAPIANAPSGVIRTLACDDAIEVARPVLIQSERLGERELVAVAGKSRLHRAAIAQRKSLSEAVTEVLVARGDGEVVHAVVGNKDARFSEAGFRMLVERAVGDDALAIVVGRRHDIPRPQFLMLLAKASPAVRARLGAEKQASPEAPAAALGDRRNEDRNGAPDAAAAPADVERQNGRIGEAEIYRYARDRKFEQTAIALSILCDTPIEVVKRALHDPGAGIVLILAKVAGLSSATTKAVLQLRAADRGMAANDLEQALVKFDRLPPDAASRVLSFFRTRVKMPAVAMAPPAVAVSG